MAARAEYQLAEFSTARRHMAAARGHAKRATAADPRRLAITRRLDRLLLPFLALLFLINWLDKSNIGNSETAHFTRDAHLQPQDVNTAVALFFGFFVVLSPLSAYLGRRFGMVRWVPTTMLLWGACTCLNAGIGAAWQLYLLRIATGVLESGFYPTCVSYLSLFYTRYEFAKRLGIFYGQSTVAGALGGLISWAVFSLWPPSSLSAVSSGSSGSSLSSGSTVDSLAGSLDSSSPSGSQVDTAELRTGWAPWQALFVIEGSVTILLALVGYSWLPHGPGSAWFLTPEQRAEADRQIAQDRSGESVEASYGAVLDGSERMSEEYETVSGGDAHTGDEPDETGEQEEPDRREAEGLLDPMQAQGARQTDSGVDMNDAVSAFVDWKVWVLLLLNIMSAIPAAAFSIFLPLVVAGMGFSPEMANLLVVPPFLLGAMALALFVWWSDQAQERLRPILWALAILLAGLVGQVLIPHSQYTARYVSLCVLMGGSWVASPLTIAWLADNIPQPGKRAVVLGINGWGNLAGVFSSLIFAPRWAPDYRVSFAVTLLLVALSFAGFALFRRRVLRRSVLQSGGQNELASPLKVWIVRLAEKRLTGVSAEVVLAVDRDHKYTV